MDEAARCPCDGCASVRAAAQSALARKQALLDEVVAERDRILENIERALGEHAKTGDLAADVAAVVRTLMYVTTDNEEAAAEIRSLRAFVDAARARDDAERAYDEHAGVYQWDAFAAANKRYRAALAALGAA